MKKLILCLLLSVTAMAAQTRSLASEEKAPPTSKVYYCYYQQWTPILALKIINLNTGAIVLNQDVASVPGNPPADNSNCVAQATALNGNREVEQPRQCPKYERRKSSFCIPWQGSEEHCYSEVQVGTYPCR